MKTPIQQLIEQYQEMRKNGDKVDLGTVIFLARQMLEKEKEVIMNAHHCGRAFENKYPASAKHYDESAEQYYNETFNTKEK